MVRRFSKAAGPVCRTRCCECQRYLPDMPWRLLSAHSPPSRIGRYLELIRCSTSWRLLSVHPPLIELIAPLKTLVIFFRQSSTSRFLTFTVDQVEKCCAHFPMHLIARKTKKKKFGGLMPFTTGQGLACLPQIIILRKSEIGKPMYIE